ncbi:MAG: hypothetical protein AB7V48_00815 [Sedimentibacter sp.]
MFKICCSMDMLEKLKSYTAKHRLDDDADKNVLICTKVALNLSNRIMGYEENKEFSNEEIDKIEQALNEDRHKTKIYRTKDGKHYALEPILNDGRYCNEKECDVAGIYSIPKEYKMFISGGRLCFEDEISLINNNGEPAIGIYKYKSTESGFKFKLSDKIELMKVQSDAVKYKKTMKDIEKNLNETKENDRDTQVKDKEQINKIYELCQEIIHLNNMYENSGVKYYFDYDGTIELLDKTKEKIESSLRCLRPGNLPDDIVWCENVDLDYSFDPFVYDGSMNIKDFKKVQAASLKDLGESSKINVKNYSSKSPNNRDFER